MMVPTDWLLGAWESFPVPGYAGAMYWRRRNPRYVELAAVLKFRLPAPGAKPVYLWMTRREQGFAVDLRTAKSCADASFLRARHSALGRSK